MQELLFPELSEYADETFDEFDCLLSTQIPHTGADRYVCLFEKQDNNGKKIYLVGERTLTTTPHGTRFMLHDVREYKHSKDRAFSDYKERLDDPR